jgi:hypothetical protein
MKTPWIAAAICLGVACFASYGYYTKNHENQKLALSNVIYVAENRILKDEVTSLERKPTYEDGCRDTIIKMGGPQHPGAYMDGWNAAILTLDTKSYADGYHNAIQQFGYQKTNNARWLIEEPYNTTPRNQATPVKYPPKDEKDKK